MEQFQAIPKKWGNSLGITIPIEVVKQKHIKPLEEITVLLMDNSQKKLKTVFGTLDLKKKTQEVMDEIDKSYNEQ